MNKQHLNLFDLSGKVAVVTGAAGLLGREHCLALSNAGAHVIATDANMSGCEKMVDDLHGLGTESLEPLEMDITNRSSIESAAAQILASHDRIDILVNNAAVNDAIEHSLKKEYPGFETFGLEAWNGSLEVNITGVFLCCQVFGGEMAKRGRGSIINIASTYGLVAPDQSLYRRPDGTQEFYKGPAYPATKGAVLSLTRYLASYWGNKSVRVNALSPGGVENGQERHFIDEYSRRTPLGRMARPSEYRGALVFLASDAASYVTGTNLIVDGGWTIW
ncbi:MAG TPA: SDR family oxidoreductase [Bacteroidota bacterium]|nr:SDR family oxidoreductase [Bacteroidota bacterium]